MPYSLYQHWLQRVQHRQCVLLLLIALCFRAFLCSLFQLNVLHSELAKQLADTMILPIIQFREKDLTGKLYYKFSFSSWYFFLLIL